jgi:hypothetical protein
MPDDENPPVRRFKLKPKEITRTDTTSRPGDGTEISVGLMHRMNEIAAERSSLRRRDAPPESLAELAPPPGQSPVLLPRDVELTDPRAHPGDGTTISVDLIHRQNRNSAEKLGPEIVAMPPKRKSRRTRDYFMLLAIADIPFVILLVAGPRTPGTVALASFVIVFGSSMLTWVMFGVMDDY